MASNKRSSSGGIIAAALVSLFVAWVVYEFKNPLAFGYFAFGYINELQSTLSKDGKESLGTAIGSYTVALELGPENPEYYHRRGKVHLELSHYDEALTDFTKAIELKPALAKILLPELAKIHCSRGYQYDIEHEYDKALEEYDRAIQSDANHAHAYYLRSWTFLQLSEYDLAFTDMNQAIAKDPENAEFYRARAVLWRNVFEYDKSTEDCSKALHLDPRLNLTYCSRGLTYAAMGEKEKALRDFEAYLEREPEGHCATLAREKISVLRSQTH